MTISNPNIVVPDYVPDVVPLPKVFQAPPSLTHPGQIDFESFGNHPALKQASDALKYAWDEGSAINELRANPNDEHRAAQHDRIVGEKVQSGQGTSLQRFASADTGLKRSLAEVESGLIAKAGLTPDRDQFDAITSAFFQMSAAERSQTINDLIDDGDHAALATLIKASLFLTRLTKEQRAAIKERVLMKVDPQAVKLRNALSDAITKLDAASLASLTMFNDLRAGTGPGAWKERAKLAAARNMAANGR